MSSPSPSPAQRKWLAIGASLVVAGVTALLVRRRQQRRLAVSRANLPQQTRYTQVRITEAHSYEEYLAAVKRVAQQLPIDQPFYVYVGAANDVATGTPWCGDCRRSNPVVDAAFDRAASSQPSLLMVSVFVDRASYRDTSKVHPLRTDAELHLTAVPTLFKFVNQRCVAKLVEDDCTKPELVEAFIREEAQLP